MIEYHPRYSDTDQPDKQGRWARIATFKDIRIARIRRTHYFDNIDVFIVRLYFPTLYTDTGNDCKVCDSLEEAKAFIQERWEWFTTQIIDK